VSEEGAALRGHPSKLRAGRVNEQRPLRPNGNGEAEEKVPGVKPGATFTTDREEGYDRTATACRGDGAAWIGDVRVTRETVI
jgi:hypothetical protein